MLIKLVAGVFILSFFSCVSRSNEDQIEELMKEINNNQVTIDKLDRVNKSDSGNYSLKQVDTLNKEILKSDEADKLMEIIERDK